MVNLYLLLLTLLGLSVGSFLNVVTTRLPAGKSLVGRSRCPKCKAVIRWYDNVPIVSFVVLSGRCRQCHKPIHWQYPVLEALTGGLYLLISWRWLNDGITAADIGYLVRDLAACAVLVAVFVIDLRHYLIFDVITLPAAGLALMGNVLLGESWSSLVAGGILGAGFFYLQYAVSRGQWIGGGDIRLGLLMGFLLGLPRLLVALFLAYAVGAIVGLGLIISQRKSPGSQVPFGTFLSLATLIALLVGDRLIAWYANDLPRFLGMWLGI